MMRVEQLLLPAISSIQRREKAGTLIAGSCRPVEECWYAAVLQFDGKSLSPNTQSQAPYFGYNVFLMAASVALVLSEHITDADASERLAKFVFGAL